MTSQSRHPSASSSIVPSILSLLLRRGITTIPTLRHNQTKITSSTELRHKSLNALENVTRQGAPPTVFASLPDLEKRKSSTRGREVLSYNESLMNDSQTSLF